MEPDSPTAAPASPRPTTRVGRGRIRRGVGVATVLAALLAAGTTGAAAGPAPATGAGSTPWATPATVAGTPATPLLRAATRVPVGFSPGFSILEESLSDLRRDLDQMKAMGVRRIRLDLSWAWVEHTRGRYDWSRIDQVFNEVRKRGITILAVIGYQPDWAQRYASDGRPLSVDKAGFARFAAAAAKRYRKHVGAWEIWNEPNLQRFWIAPPSAAEYAAVVNAVAPRIRAGDPSARILVGSMSPANDVPDRSTVSPMTFLRGIYARVPLKNFDAVSVHPYSYPAMPTGTEEWNTFFRMHVLRQIMVAHGDRASRMWLTEYGAPTGTGDEAVSASTQATMLVSGVREARRRAWAGPIYLYSLRDAGTNPDEREDNFGLLTYDRRPKAAYGALRQEIARTRP